MTSETPNPTTNRICHVCKEAETDKRFYDFSEMQGGRVYCPACYSRRLDYY